MAVWLRLKSVPSAPPRVDSMLSKCINGQYFRRNYLVMQMGHPFTPLVCGFWGDVCNSCELLLLDSWQLFNQHCNVDNLSQQWIYETPESVQWFPFSFHESCLSMSILPNVVKCGEYRIHFWRTAAASSRTRDGLSHHWLIANIRSQ